MTSLTGWHPGERLARQKTGFDAIPSTRMLWASIQGEMPEQHSTFYSTRLPFIPVCVLDNEGRPWGSFLVGKDGKPGFVTHPRYDTLKVQAALWEGDPFLRAAGVISAEGQAHGSFDDANEKPMIAGIGVEVSTRRRNKFAGHIKKLVLKEQLLDMELVVNEAIGNCPKYITLRELAPVDYSPQSNTTAKVAEDHFHLSPEDRLSDAAVSFILAADTIFLGTAYIAPEDEAKSHPSHLGMNHRGGRPGFIRVKGDGRTVVVPDFSGNRFMTSLGNIEATPLAGISIPSFTNGDILYLTGTARNVYGSEAHSIMPFQDRLTEIHVTGYTFVRGALPLRAIPEHRTEGSPYSPPVRLLAEEMPRGSKLFNSTAGQGLPKALLVKVEVHAPHLATFVWKMEKPSELDVQPGQAVIMDFKTLLGERRYAHMTPGKPSAVNDDYVRTWTVSRCSSWSSLRTESSSSGSEGEREASTRHTISFALTMREKPGGTVTNALFSVVRKLQQFKPEILDDARPLELQVGVVGITGDFVLPLLPPLNTGSATPTTFPKLVWIAGGIGITPFLAMLRALTTRGSQQDSSSTPQITLVVSTREAEVMVSLISQALDGKPLPSTVSVHIFSTTPPVPPSSSATLASSPDPAVGVPSADVHTAGATGSVSQVVASPPPSGPPAAQDAHVSGLPFTQHLGRVRLDAVLDLSGSIDDVHGDAQFYVCGPLYFETAISDSLTGLGVAPGNIHRETFAY